MVSKIAVIALVAIVACPILLGYAMNLSETTVTDYKGSGESVNVTPLLQEGTEYNYAQADLNSLNTKFTTEDDNYYLYPDYNNLTTIKSSIKLTKWIWPSTLTDYSATTYSRNYTSMYAVFDYNPDLYNIKLNLYIDNGGDYLNRVINHVHSFYLDYEHNLVKYRYYSGSYGPDGKQELIYGNNGSFLRQTVEVVGTVNDLSAMYIYNEPGVSTSYVDISQGYYLNKYNTNQSIASMDNYAKLSLPTYPRDLLMTMDFSKITASSYEFQLINQQTDNDNILYFVKSTDGSGPHWRVYRDALHTDLIADLYYDSTKSSNTYQIYLNSSGGQFRYVGDWPALIGEANYYLTYDFDWLYTTESVNLGSVLFGGQMTPLMRIDAASYRAFEYQIIENQSYTPATFKSNPATTISNPVLYGTSLTFGGNTYTVTDGKINISGHDVPVKDLVLSSIPNDGGTYDNRIGNTVISTTAQPSTITFNGKWSASISTQSMESYTYTHTEWIAGSFGWDGVDQNFLIVGLITCLGVFVALGIYARKSRSGGIIPLMIVTGCAAAVFFIML